MIGLDATSRQVVLHTGGRLCYDRLVVATGASATAFPGDSPQGVHTLRSMSDCLALRADLARGGPLVVVGGGFIGAEIASTARARGLAVTLVDPLASPMSQTLGDEVGRLLAELHADHGVDVRCGLSVTGFEGGARVRGVLLSDGSVIDADAVAVGIGVRPNTEWLNGSGLEVDDGLLCDEYCAADPEGTVYAVGDVARWYADSVGRHIRIEHWTNATEQANTVAHNLLNPEHRRPHTARPYFWSDQHGCKIQMIGHVSPDCAVKIIYGRRARQQLAALYQEGETVPAALTINWPRALATASKAMSRDLPATETIAGLQALA